METTEIILYEFSELSKDVQEKAKMNYLEYDYCYFEIELDEFRYLLTELKELKLKELEAIQHLIDLDILSGIELSDYSLGCRGSYAKFNYYLDIDNLMQLILKQSNYSDKELRRFDLLINWNAITYQYLNNKREHYFYIDYMTWLDKYPNLEDFTKNTVYILEKEVNYWEDLIQDVLQDLALNYWSNIEDYFYSGEYFLERIEANDYKFLENGEIYE